MKFKRYNIKNHPKYQVIGDLFNRIITHSSLCNTCANLAFISQVEPKSVKNLKRRILAKSHARRIK